jgi:hypothetical protein
MRLKQHLKERGMNPDLYKPAYGYSASKVTFYLYNLSGQLVGYQHYRPKAGKKRQRNDPKFGRYFTYCPAQTIAVFGLECLDRSKKTLFVTEGVFKAAVLHRLGYNAIAVLTSTPKPMKPWFRVLKRKYDLVAIGDNDDAGRKLVNTVGNGFQSPLDLDEMTDEAILELIKGY